MRRFTYSLEETQQRVFGSVMVLPKPSKEAVRSAYVAQVLQSVFSSVLVSSAALLREAAQQRVFERLLAEQQRAFGRVVILPRREAERSTLP